MFLVYLFPIKRKAIKIQRSFIELKDGEEIMKIFNTCHISLLKF